MKTTWWVEQRDGAIDEVYVGGDERVGWRPGGRGVRIGRIKFFTALNILNGFVSACGNVRVVDRKETDCE